MNSQVKPATLLSIANAKFREAEYREAIDAYRQLLRDNPELGKSIQFNLELAQKRLNGHSRTHTEVKVTQASPAPTPEKPAARESKTAYRFDPEYYLQENDDVREAGINPEEHYWSNGEREGRKPNPWFDPSFYYRLNADVRKAGISAFRHYIDSGRQEGRASHSPAQDGKRVTTAAHKPLLFVGHDGVLAGSEIVLLEVVRWFYNHTTRRIKLLLLAPGPIADRYAEFADVYVLPGDGVDQPEDLKAFLSENFEFAYLNTVVSGRLFNYLEQAGARLDCTIVTHIHEMEKVLATFPDEMDALLSRTRHWISASPASSATLEAKYKIATETLTTVPAFINPVARKEVTTNELQAEAREELGLSPNAFVVMGCGTVYERKGPDLFLEAARLLKKQTNQPIEFVWLGQGPDKETLEASLTEEEKGWVIFAGNRNNANKLLAAADVFFMSSREDPFPLVVLESAQHGVPTVCFEPATGITAFIEQDAGIAVPEISPQLAAKALQELLEHPHYRQELGNNARAKLFANYTTDQQNLKIYRTIQEVTDYKPSVSVIVPFYNHEKFIEERLDSILAQPIKDIEVIALDDCSTDSTVAKVRPYLQDSRVTLIENETNSGSPFKQWEKGIRLAQGDVVWIAEGDDSCDSNYIQTLLPYFDDPMVNIVGAKTEIIDEHGTLKENALSPYLDMAFPGKFDKSYVKDGFQEINEQLGAMCTLVNASGLLIRKQSFGDTLSTAQSFKMCGDWLIYLECLKGGKIAYDINTRNYFRRHSASQVHKVEGTEVYFNERYAITDFVAENFTVSRRMLKKAFAAINHEWERFAHKNPGKTLPDLYNQEAIRIKSNFLERQPHVAFYVHGMMFSKGGIERLAGQIANHLVENGWQVTIFCKTHPSRKPIYPLYESVKVLPLFDEHKLEKSVKALNTALCHSDIDVFVPMLSEWLFEPVIEAAQNTGVAIIASEHNDPWKIQELWWEEEKRISCFRKVDKVHLLLDKYRESLPSEFSEKTFVLPNGVSIPEVYDDQPREKLIVSVGRLAPQKRFDRLIEAVALVQDSVRGQGYRCEIYGDGPLYSELHNQINSLNVDDIVILKGATPNIEAVYRKADFFVLPSDFEGLPITLLEALSFGLPSVAFQDCNGPNEIIQSDVNGKLVGDVKELGDVITAFITDQFHQSLRANARARASAYSLENCLSAWLTEISGVINEK
ncbi:glycosyltransferase [Marinobacter xiaoshiensis]|uniref:Glycosyltransferase n=1 Tax=Marinobacter xiaoshiensis TaxID=3073652 RepID=A0ABU2HEH1_9GAMM|nr:glycosyltransferase [Marinobacter sp. F60267]MDS1309459.1 glycosyltransferase [Marinobacter sp. F60267]